MTDQSHSPQHTDDLRTLRPSEPPGATSGLEKLQPKSERYEVIEQIGAGGMGFVWKAADLRFQNLQECEQVAGLQRIVALKRMHPDLIADPQFLRRFRRETLTVASLQHPCIVPVLDFDEDHQGPFLVLQWIDGHDLHTAVQTAGPFPPRISAALLAGVADALHAAHQQGIAHRDVKPGNILLDKHQHSYLTDFGLAFLHDNDSIRNSRITLSGQKVGTPHFMPPENVTAELQSGVRGDIWSLGKTLYFICTGRVQLQESRIPAELRTVINTATAEFPEERYADMFQFAAALRQAANAATNANSAPAALADIFCESPAESLLSQTPSQPQSPVEEIAPDEWDTPASPGLLGRWFRRLTDE